MTHEHILVVCAHPDDAVFGCGGTIAKYVEQSKVVHVIRFSYGEKSHTWMKEEVTQEMRKNEAEEAKSVLGFHSSQYLGFEEMKFMQNKEKAREVLLKFIDDFRPIKIFTHNIHDPHKDHKEVGKMVLDVVEDMDIKTNVYMFDVWNVINLRRMEYPLLYVDITETFSKKLQALNTFKSQFLAKLLLLWSVYSSAIVNGISHNVRFAEKFYKIK